MDEKQDYWRNAATGYGNLSELQLSLGRLESAISDAGRAVNYADRSGDAFQRMVMRTVLADALHQHGETEQAAASFAEAEALQREYQPEYPLLYSVQGFQYCDALLAGAVRAAWGQAIAGKPAPTGGDEGHIVGWVEARNPTSPAAVAAMLGFVPQPNLPQALADCAAVATRAGQTLQWAEMNKAALLDIALDHLTLARVALYIALLQAADPSPAREHVEQAVAGLRAAGHMDYLPLGLLTRAWLAHSLGDEAAARADLAEVERIASRGNMRLHLADLHLTRARLFGDTDALAQARRLIEQCGYFRRLPELEDAEAWLG